MTTRCRFGFLTLLAGIAATLLTVPACSPRRDRDPSPFEDEPPSAVLAVVLDLSGSFTEYLKGEDAIAWRFFMTVTERFCQQAGPDCRIVLAQLSGSAKSVLWEGSPRALKSQFGSAKAFRDFLMKYADPSGSRVHDTIRDTVDHVLSINGVVERKVRRTCVIVLSDMEDNAGDSAASRQQLLESLRRYAKCRGALGIYWASQDLVAPWRRDLASCGLKHFIVLGGVTTDPPLPTFDD